MRSAIVIGGGVSGLAAAAELSRRGVSVRLLERRDQVGGVIRTRRKNGFLLESGPSEMLVKSQEVIDLIASYGLADQIVHSNPVSRRRYIIRNGRPVPVPMSPVEALGSPLFSLKGKLRLLKEPFISQSNLSDETVSSFVKRRVGREFLDYAVGPLTSGIFAGDPECLSVRHAFPKIWNLEAQYGGLIKGAVCLARERKRSGGKRWRNQLISFKEGMQQLPVAIANSLDSGAIYFGAHDVEVSKAGQWVTKWKSSTGEHVEQTDAVVLALPVHAMASVKLPDTICEGLKITQEIHYPQVSVVTLGFRRSSVSHPLDGFGMLASQVEDRRILGALFLSSLFEGRAPDGYVSLLVFVGGATKPAQAALPSDQLIASIMEELHELLGISDNPVLVNHQYWCKSIPQYNLGYQQYLDAIEATEKLHNGLAIVGNFRGGPGVGDCLINATQRMKELVQELS